MHASAVHALSETGTELYKHSLVRLSGDSSAYTLENAVGVHTLESCCGSLSVRATSEALIVVMSLLRHCSSVSVSGATSSNAQ
jgi:hypothetical protein